VNVSVLEEKNGNKNKLLGTKDNFGRISNKGNNINFMLKDDRVDDGSRWPFERLASAECLVKDHGAG
jgi:hypothetical protein